MYNKESVARDNEWFQINGSYYSWLTRRQWWLWPWFLKWIGPWLTCSCRLQKASRFKGKLYLLYLFQNSYLYLFYFKLFLSSSSLTFIDYQLSFCFVNNMILFIFPIFMVVNDNNMISEHIGTVIIFGNLVWLHNFYLV